MEHKKTKHKLDEDILFENGKIDYYSKEQAKNSA